MRRFMIGAALGAALMAQAMTVDATGQAVTDYCWSVGGHTKHPALQGSVTVNGDLGRGRAVFGGGWFSHGAGQFGDEIDLYVGLAGRTGRGRWSATAFWYDLHPVLTEGTGDMIELTGTYGYDLNRRLKVSGGLRWMQPVGRTPPGVPVPYLEGDYRIPLDHRWQVGLRERLSYDSGVYGGDAGLISRSSLSLARPVAVGTVGVAVDLSWPLAGIRDRTTNLIFSTSWSATF